MSAYPSQPLVYMLSTLQGNKANSCKLPASNAIYSYQMPDNHATTQSSLSSVTDSLSPCCRTITSVCVDCECSALLGVAG